MRETLATFTGEVGRQLPPPMSGKCGWHWTALPCSRVLVFIWTWGVCRGAGEGSVAYQALSAGAMCLPWDRQQGGWVPWAAMGLFCLTATEQPLVTPTLRLWGVSKADTVPGNEQNCKPEVGRTTTPLHFGGIGCILFFPLQSELSLESSCVIAAFIILPFLSQSGIYRPSNVDIVQSTLKPQH